MYVITKTIFSTTIIYNKNYTGANKRYFDPVNPV